MDSNTTVILASVITAVAGFAGQGVLAVRDERRERRSRRRDALKEQQSRIEGILSESNEHLAYYVLSGKIDFRFLSSIWIYGKEIDIPEDNGSPLERREIAHRIVFQLKQRIEEIAENIARL